MLVHHVTALMLHLLYRLPRRATHLLLVSLRVLVRLSFRIAGGVLSPENIKLVDRLPVDIRTVVDRFQLDPHTRPYVCCPKCFALYPKESCPQMCSHKPTTDSKPCGSALNRTRLIRGQSHTFPIRVYLYQEMKEWLARLLSRHGVEDLMDAANTEATGQAKADMSDILDAPIFRNLLKDGVPFLQAPPGEGRYVFALSIDSFNPFQSKEAKQNVAVTGVYMICLNLPPHLRYLPENVYLVGVIPGPTKPSLDEINHFLQPLVDELLVFWDTGVYYTRTAKYALGRLVRCALVPLVCDLPAARQTAGFGGHKSKFFCHMCKLPRSSINNIDVDSWVPRTCEDHKETARKWRDLPTPQLRQAAFKQNSIRWSELFRLSYWDPIQYTVIDSMHNHYLGLLKHHCRNIWRMNISDKESGEKSNKEPSYPTEEELSVGWDCLNAGTDTMVASCTVKVLRYLCYSLDIRHKRASKARLVQLLVDWV